MTGRTGNRVSNAANGGFGAGKKGGGAGMSWRSD
jgi:hypothetical protein